MVIKFQRRTLLCWSSFGSITIITLVVIALSLNSKVTKTPAITDKIKHIVVLMEENRSFDHMLGWLEADVDGLTGQEYNLVNTSDLNSTRVFVNKVNPYISPCDPGHGTTGTTFKIFGADAMARNDTSVASMSGFAEWEATSGNTGRNLCEVMSTFAPENVPIMTSLAQEFGVMDRFFASYPGPTWPNRLFALSGTSLGLTSTGNWYHNVPGTLFPQPTIFDQLTSEGLSWRNYYNDTVWELLMQSVAHNTENLMSLEQFFVDAREGNLPSLSWINPRSGINMTLMQGSNDQHPDHDVALGEAYYKDIYEALRASPQWENTLFIITYDEHGGYYDHVPTPLNVPPPGDDEQSYPDKGIFFDRLGVRIPTLLISPWIPKGMIIKDPPAAHRPAPNSEYSLTSLLSTTRKLLGMSSPPLTARDAWSPSFEHVFSLDAPRTDCPLHLPDAPAPSAAYSAEKEAQMPINDLQRVIMEVHAHLAGVSFPDHVRCQGDVAAWTQEHFCVHHAKTAQWKASKGDEEGPQVLLRASSAPGWLAFAWVVSHGTQVAYNTISTTVASLNATLCLDRDADGLVGVSHCYPGSDPDTNRDASQQWVWGKDAAVRTSTNDTLCLTASFLTTGDPQVYVKPCSLNDIEQHFSYKGSAPGNIYTGRIWVGDGDFAVGVVNSTTAMEALAARGTPPRR